VSEDLSFEDGIILCKYIYQSVIDKTLNGVIEQEEIFIKAHESLAKIDNNYNAKRVDELLKRLNLEKIYSQI